MPIMARYALALEVLRTKAHMHRYGSTRSKAGAPNLSAKPGLFIECHPKRVMQNAVFGSMSVLASMMAPHPVASTGDPFPSIIAVFSPCRFLFLISFNWISTQSTKIQPP